MRFIMNGKHLVTVSPPPMFGGKAGYCAPEEIFAAALASCINTLYLLIARNSQLKLKGLETAAAVTLHVEGLEKLIFTNIHFEMEVKLETDNDRERKKAESVYKIAQKICPIRQSWGKRAHQF